MLLVFFWNSLDRIDCNTSLVVPTILECDITKDFSHGQGRVDVSYPCARTMTWFWYLMGFKSSLPQLVWYWKALLLLMMMMISCGEQQWEKVRFSPKIMLFPKHFIFCSILLHPSICTTYYYILWYYKGRSISMEPPCQSKASSW